MSFTAAEQTRQSEESAILNLKFELQSKSAKGEDESVCILEPDETSVGKTVRSLGMSEW